MLIDISGDHQLNYECRKLQPTDYVDKHLASQLAKVLLRYVVLTTYLWGSTIGVCCHCIFLFLTFKKVNQVGQ